MKLRFDILAICCGFVLALPVAAAPPSSFGLGVGSQNRLDSPRYQISPFQPTWSVPLVRQSTSADSRFLPVDGILRDALRRGAQVLEVDASLRGWLQKDSEHADRTQASNLRSEAASRSVVHVVLTDLLEQAEDSQQLIRELVTLVDEGTIQEAAARATAALETNVGDARLWFVFGFALYKQGDNEKAIEAFRTAEELEYTSPGLYQVLGEALVANGQYDDALKALESAGDTGRQALSRAMALTELGRTDEALDAARTALARTPDLAAEAHLLIASLKARSGNLSSASYNLERSQREASARIEATGDSGAEELAESAARFQQLLDRPRDPLEAAIDPYRRWTDQYASGTTVLPSFWWTDNDMYDSSGRNDAIAGIEARGWRRLRGDANRGVTALWRIGSDLYTGTGQSDDLLADVGLDAYKQDCCVSYGAYVGYRYTMVGGETFLNDATSRLRVSLAEREWTQTTLLYQLDLREVGFDVLPEEDRDGQLHRIVLSQDFFLPRCNESGSSHSAILTPYAQWGHDQARGVASRNDFWTLGVDGVALSGNRRLYAGVSWQTRNFSQPHIRNFFLTSRDDDIWNARVGVAWQLNPSTTFACEWQLTTLDSLVDAFDFERNVLGVRFEWRPW